jgi:hypothetical protein
MLARFTGGQNEGQSEHDSGAAAPLDGTGRHVEADRVARHDGRFGSGIVLASPKTYTREMTCLDFSPEMTRRYLDQA